MNTLPTPLYNIIENYKVEMEEFEKNEYEDFLFYLSISNYKNLKLNEMKNFLKKSNKYFKIKGYYKMNKKELKEKLISRQQELLK